MTMEHKYLKKLYYEFPVVLLGYKDEKLEYNFTLNGSSFSLGDIIIIAMDEYGYALNQIKRSNCFTVNVPSGELLREIFREFQCCGIISGVDKFKALSIFNCEDSENINAPIVNNCSINFECEVFEILDFFDEEKNEKVIIGKIIKRNLNKEIMDDGVYCDENLSNIIFDKRYKMSFYKYLTHVKWT